MSQPSVEAIYFEALEKGTPEERTTYLDQVCGQDKALRRKVDRMLSMHANVGEFLEKPAISHLSSSQFRATKVEMAVPESLGKYQILKEVARGGMGVVYQAWDASLKRHVAIKMVLAGRYGGKQEQQRFQKESEVVARLQHPNIVQIHEVGQYQEMPFLVLEWIDGGSLSHYLKRHTLQPREAAVLIHQLAQGLQFAHSLGIIHRDLKPGNILLDSKLTNSSSASSITGQSSSVPAPLEPHQTLPINHYSAKITDFGLAKLTDEEEHLTQTGQVMGTPSYLSPEQAKGTKLVGPANDIYSLGAILYELLSGKPPHVAKTPMETVLKVIQEEVKPLSQIKPGLPLDLITICQKCLMREPAKRYASAGHLADDLQRYLQGEPIQARPVGRSERLWLWVQRKPALATTMAVALFAVLLGTIISIMFGINATFHANQADKLAEEANASRKIALEEQRNAKAQSSSLILEQSQSIAEGGKIDRGLYTMLRAWENAPPDNEAFENLIRMNIDAWLPYTPRLLWQVDSKTERFISFANYGTDVVLWSDGHFVHRDAWTGVIKRKQKEEQLKFPISYDYQPDLSRITIQERGESKSLLFDVNIWKPVRELHYQSLKQSPARTLLRIQWIEGIDQPIIRSTFRNGSKVMGSIQACNGTMDKTTGPEIVASADAMLEPVLTRDGKPVVVVGELNEQPVVKDLFTGEPLDIELSQLNWSLWTSPATGLVQAPAMNFERCSISYLDRDVIHNWHTARLGSGWIAQSHDGQLGLHSESNNIMRFYDLVNRQPLLNSITIADERLTYGFDTYQSSFNPHGPLICVFGQNTTRVYQLPLPLGSSFTVPENAVKTKSRLTAASFSPEKDQVFLYQQNTQQSNGFLMRLPDREYCGKEITGNLHKPTWSKDGRYLALTTPPRDGVMPRVQVIDTATGTPIFSHVMPQYVHSLAFSNSGDLLAVGLVGGVLLHDLNGSVPGQLLRQPGPIVQMEFSHDDQVLIASSRSGWTGTQPGFRLWNVADGEPLGNMVPTEEAPWIHFIAHDKIMMIDLTKGTENIFSSRGELVKTIHFERYSMKANPELAGTMAVNQQSNQVAICRSDGTVGLWSLESGKLIGGYSEHNDAIRHLDFSPDGRWLAIGVGPHRIRLRDTRTGMAVGAMLTSPNIILTIGFSKDSRVLYTLDDSGIPKSVSLAPANKHDRNWYQNQLETYSGLTIQNAEDFRLLNTESWRSRPPVAENLSTTVPFSKPRWHREQALDCWQRKLDKAALWHLMKWSEMEPGNSLPLLYQAEIHLANNDLIKANQCRADLIKREKNAEIETLYRIAGVESPE